jgi:hypothetical protein
MHRDVDPDEMYETEIDEAPELGPCCSCGTLERVRNIIFFPYRAPIPGKGWGCALCGLAPDGAIAVKCDACVTRNRKTKFIVSGLPNDGERIAFAAFMATAQPFVHDPAKHPGEQV